MTTNIGKVFTGFEFKQIYGNDFYKIFTNDLLHSDYQYVNGINIYSQTLNDISYTNNGIYFVETKKIPLWIGNNPEKKYIVKVDILDDSQICIAQDGFKTNKIFINFNTKCDIKNFPLWNNLEFCKLAVKHNENNFYYVKSNLINQEIAKIALKKDGTFLGRIKPELQTEELCKIALKSNPWSIKYVKDELRTEEMNKILVKHDGLMLKFVSPELQTDKICTTAIKQNPRALQFVVNQTKKLCKLAVELNAMTLRFVNPDLQTKELCLSAVQRNKETYQYVKPELRCEEINQLIQSDLV